MAANFIKYSSFRPTIDAESIAPFVQIGFVGSGGNTVITVGNESAPAPEFGPHEAVIKSFDFGASDAVTVEVEILDEQGGAFTKFVGKIINRLKDFDGSHCMTFKYGWIGTRCDGSTIQKVTQDFFLLPNGMEVTYAEGKIKYKITAKDTMQPTYAARYNETWGSDDSKMKLEDAIKKMMNQDPPKITAKFINKDGQEVDDFFRDKPRSTWDGDNQNKLSLARKWMEPFVTINDKGVRAVWDYRQKEPTILFIEGMEALPDDKEKSTDLIFLVNGGKYSNVLSFSPTINWPSAWSVFLASGGEMGQGVTGATAWNEPTPKDPNVDPHLGSQRTTPFTKPGIDVHAPKDILKKHMEGQEAHTRANAMLFPMPIEAEMRIQGDPSPQFTDPTKLGQNIKIVVINPFHLRSDTGCGDWLAEPVINNYLSSDKWIIMGISHSIKEGSFVTTLKLKLPPSGGEGFADKSSDSWAGSK